MMILKSLKKGIVTIACLLGMISAAHAAVPIFETSGTSTGSFLLNTYSFSLGSPGVYQGTLINGAAPTAFESLTLNILPGAASTKGTVLGGVSGSGTFSFLANTAGVYTALLFGVPGASGTGAFSIAVVPEVETWVMLLVGIGLIAYQLRRRNKKLVGGPALSFG